MKVGDVLIYIKTNSDYGHGFTNNKGYRIFKIDRYLKNELYCWIKDDYDNSCYFTEDNAVNDNWKYLKDIRKLKLEKLEKLNEF